MIICPSSKRQSKSPSPSYYTKPKMPTSQYLIFTRESYQSCKRLKVFPILNSNQSSKHSSVKEKQKVFIPNSYSPIYNKSSQKKANLSFLPPIKTKEILECLLPSLNNGTKNLSYLEKQISSPPLQLEEKPSPEQLPKKSNVFHKIQSTNAKKTTQKRRSTRGTNLNQSTQVDDEDLSGIVFS